MGFVSESVVRALELIISLEGEMISIVWTSLYTSVTAVIISALFGIPLGLAIGLGKFWGRRVVIILLNTLMAMPTVVIGLLVYGMISRQGPLGYFGLLFTPWAIIIGQVVLATPIVANYTLAAVEGSDPRIISTAITLGAGKLQRLWLLITEIRFGVMAALVAGFGRVIAEVGVAMMLGGNIKHSTRTMTTAIALDTSMGEFAFALALGIVLLSVALLVNLFLILLQHR